MNKYEFFNGFCKVDFLCHQSEPNWLGWIVLVVGGVYAVGFIVMILIGIFE